MARASHCCARCAPAAPLPLPEDNAATAGAVHRYFTSHNSVRAVVLLAVGVCVWFCCCRSSPSSRPAGKQIVSPIPISEPPPTTSTHIPTHTGLGECGSAGTSEKSALRDSTGRLRAVSLLDAADPPSAETDGTSLTGSRQGFGMSRSVTNPLAMQSRRGAGDALMDSHFSEDLEQSSMSQQLDFMMSSMRSKIQTAVADMQAELQEELQEDDLKIHHVLGQGAFGTVYHGPSFP